MKDTGSETRARELSRRIAALSPVRRELLERILKSTQAASAGHDLERAGRLSAPLSFAQQRLWFLDRFDGGSTAYHMPGALRLRGDLNRPAFERALQAIVARHESLRTRFVEVDGAPLQVVDPESSMALRVQDLGDGHGEAQGHALAEALRRDQEAPFDLRQGPLLRTTLFRLGPRDHVFSWTFHHIVSDGWSTEVFKRELAVLYGAFCQGRSSALAPLPVQYSDYAAWQRQRITPEALDGLVTHWLRTLDGAPALLALPTDKPRAPQGVSSGTSRTTDLPPRLVASLSEICRREGATLFMALLGAFKVLLARCSGQDDVVVGTPALGRDHVNLEGLIGFFINTVVLRTSLSGNPTFGEVLARVRETTLAAFEHGDLPFEKLVDELHLDRNLGHTPVFQVFFNMLSLDDAPAPFPLDVDAVSLPEPAPKFALTLYIRKHQHNVQCRLVCRSDLFSPARVISLLEQYVNLLEQVVAMPDNGLLDYSLVTAGARPWLPDPATPIDAPSHTSVVERVLSWARVAPEQIAVRESGREWPYAELTDRALSLAVALRDLGVERGDVVAIVGPTGCALAGAMLGVLMSGGAFLTIDPTLPAQRKKVMLIQAGTKVACLIGQPASFDQDTCAIVRTDLDLTLPPGAPRPPKQALALPAVDGDDPAYVFFTSGSSGEPKAVLGCHKGLSHFLDWQRDTFAVRPNDRVSQLIGLTFDPLLRDVFLPLTSGATLCVPAERDLLDTLGWMMREGVTIVHTTPTVLQSWVADGRRPIELPLLRWLFIAGEPLGDALIARWRATVSGPAQLVNLYGPTETTMACCFYPIPADVTPGVQPVGFPLPESQALVLGVSGVLCGIGEGGEIVVRTPYRSLGYLNLPDENARRFRPNPFRNDASDLVYFTGDRGHYLEGGLLEVTGRVDDEVKIRGVRINPGEVTATLARLDGVRSCVVVGRTDAHRQQQLVGYVVSDKQLDAHDLRTYLTAQLPKMFVPHAFVFMDALPLLANGKVDRRALPPPDEREAPSDGFVPARTSLEEQIAKVWCEVLKLPRVGVHDDFFDLGGHSLLAIQVLVRLTTRLGVELPLRTLFEAPTVAGLATAVEETSARARA